MARSKAPDCSRWNQAQIAEALPLVPAVSDARQAGTFAIQAAIAAVHCRAARPEDTDWREILRLYDLLQAVHPSPVVALNRAVAVAMLEGPGPGLELVDELAKSGDLERYHLLHSARADLLRRKGARTEAAEAYRQALELATNESERRYLERRLSEVLTP